MEWETDIGAQYVPMLPISLNGFPVGPILVDTGATVTIIPLSLKDVLGVELNRGKEIRVQGAGGEIFKTAPSATKITYTIEQSGFRPIEWSGIAYFTANESTLLLGHYQCLDQLVLTFDGPRKKLRVERNG